MKINRYCDYCGASYLVDGPLVASPANRVCPVCRQRYTAPANFTNSEDTFNGLPVLQRAEMVPDSLPPKKRKPRVTVSQKLLTPSSVNFNSNVPRGTEVASVFPFKSSSSPGTVYECRLYKSGATSCNCPGWSRRVGANGERECKHTREVDAKKGGILAALNGAGYDPSTSPFPYEWFCRELRWGQAVAPFRGSCQATRARSPQASPPFRPRRLILLLPDQ